MRKSCLFVSLFLMISFYSFSQSLEGKVTGIDSEALTGATIHWLGTTKHTTSDIDGTFLISKDEIIDPRLVISFVGYSSDTLIIEKDQNYIKVQLLQGNILGEVKVKANRQGTYISSIDPIKTEVISEIELSRAACCDLAGCFGTEASVQANTTNIVTNAKELRILGLSGVYNQILIDGMPLIQGLSYTYGISSIPGTLVKNIYVAKGSNSVLQGYESMVGQINVILKEPDTAEKWYLNAYMNSFLEKQFNVQFAQPVKDWHTLLAFHTTQPAKRIDQDDDEFLDLPLLTRYTFFNKWKRGIEAEWGFHSRIGIRYSNENRIGGQMNFDADIDEGKNNVYGQTVAFSQPEIYTKTGFRMDDVHHFVVMASAFQQHQDAYYGVTHYKADQENIYANVQHEFTWSKNHLLKSGFSYRYQNLDETIIFSDDILNRSYSGNYKKKESIPGFFLENTANWKDNKINLITGVRVDFHNEFGSFFTPRALLKYQWGEHTTARASVGTGWRTINLFSENVNLLASSRDILITEELQPEKSVNYGFNILRKMAGSNYEAYFSLDVYRTRFFNQIFPDYDSSPTQAIISNFEGTSIGNGLKAEINFEISKTFNSKLAYNYLDVFRIINDDKSPLPFIANHKIMGAFSYQPNSRKWHLDTNIHWYGKQRLAKTNNNPPEFQLADYSDPYIVVNAQFTKTWKQFEIYGGCENIFNFRQEKAIVGWQDPFGAYFDTSSVWGPTRGREFYVGLRYKLAQ